jgi:hypothetical protein
MRRGEIHHAGGSVGKKRRHGLRGCDDYVPNHSVHDNGWANISCNSGGVDCCGARVCLCELWSEMRTRTDIDVNT